MAGRFNPDPFKNFCPCPFVGSNIFASNTYGQIVSTSLGPINEVFQSDTLGPSLQFTQKSCSGRLRVKRTPVRNWIPRSLLCVHRTCGGINYVAEWETFNNIETCDKTVYHTSVAPLCSRILFRQFKHVELEAGYWSRNGASIYLSFIFQSTNCWQWVILAFTVSLWCVLSYFKIAHAWLSPGFYEMTLSQSIFYIQW